MIYVNILIKYLSKIGLVNSLTPFNISTRF